MADRRPVDVFLADLAHARKDEIEAVRAIVRGAHPALTERIKWNAPSFCLDGDDRITFRLQPGDRVQLVFHRGARKRADAFSFVDDTGLLEWAAPDRAIVTFGGLEDVRRKAEALATVAGRWLAATRDPA